jgi:hypothetical protein
MSTATLRRSRRKGPTDEPDLDFGNTVPLKAHNTMMAKAVCDSPFPGPGTYSYQPTCSFRSKGVPASLGGSLSTTSKIITSNSDMLSGGSRREAPSFSFGGMNVDRKKPNFGSIYQDLQNSSRPGPGTAMNTYRHRCTFGIQPTSTSRSAPRPKFGTSQRFSNGKQHPGPF